MIIDLLSQLYEFYHFYFLLYLFLIFAGKGNGVFLSNRLF